MSITKDQVIVALDIAAKLEALGFSVVIAGGFARDVYFQEPPKDLDIVIGVGSLKAGEEMEAVKQALALLEVTAQGFHMYNESTDDRIVGGFKCVGNVDVVLYRVKEATAAVDCFDFNLNQFVLLGDGSFEGSYVAYAGDSPWHELTPVRSDYSQERSNKMREKWLNLSWRYPENDGPARVKLSDGVFHDPDL